MGRAVLSRSFRGLTGRRGLHTCGKYTVFPPFLDVLSMFKVYSLKYCRIFVRNTTRMDIF